MIRTSFLRAGTQAATNYDTDEVSNETGLDTSVNPDTGEETPSLTQQSFKDECDINVIVERFGVTGVLPENMQAPISGDFTGAMTFEESMIAIRKAEEDFLTLPAKLRERFHNNPQEVMNFLDDDNNREEALKLGLISKPAEKTRDVIDAIDELKTTMTTKTT